MSRMQVLGLKGTYPPGILGRIKGFFMQGLKALWRQHDLVNLLEDGSHLLPLLIRHPRPARISVNERVHDHGPLLYSCPQGTAPGGNGSHDCCDPLIVEIARNQTPWFVERSRRDFEQIGSSLLAHHPIHPGVVIQSQGKKLKRDGDQVILVLETSSKLFLCNTRWLSHRSFHPVFSFMNTGVLECKPAMRHHQAGLIPLYEKTFPQQLFCLDIERA